MKLRKRGPEELLELAHCPWGEQVPAHAPHELPHTGSGPQLRPAQSGTQAGALPAVGGGGELPPVGAGEDPPAVGTGDESPPVPLASPAEPRPSWVTQMGAAQTSPALQVPLP
jgi:hypothetical protein